jgi:predicted permease
MFRRNREAGDFGAEIETHIQLETERLQEQGLSYEEARTAAYRAFGNVTRAQERFYESGHWIWWDDFWQDVRYALRMLRKTPGFTLIALSTIALGIGATTAIFSVVDATLLHPLPYPHPEQLVTIEDDLPGVPARDVGMSEPEWQDLQHSGIFEYVSPTWYDDNNLTGSSQPARVSLLIFAPDYFALLGVKPRLGHIFDPQNHSPGFTEEVLISDGLWKRNFGSDPHVLDKSLRLDTDLYRVVGVMPPGFCAPGPTTRERNIEVWAATSFYGPPLYDHPPRSGRNLPTAIARLKPGLTLSEAQTKVDALVAALQKQFPVDYPSQSSWTVRLIPLQQTVVGNVRRSLILLLGAVGLVLLIGCVNIANLMLARASARGREMGIRQALGAARSRLIRQLLTESLLLSVFGGIAGLTILFGAKGFLLRLLPDAVPRLNHISVSWIVLAFAVLTSILSGVIFGLAPALHAGRQDLNLVLKREGRASTGSGEQARTRRALVVTEFALSLVLMICASLLLRSFWDLLNARLGFNPQSVMTVRTRLPYPNDPKNDTYATVSQQARFFREVLRRGKMLPGVEEIAMGDLGAIPLAHDRNNQTPPVPLILEQRGTQGNQNPLVDDSIVTPEYFHLMGMSLLRGRLFSDSDNEKATEVAVINEAMAQSYWPNEDPLGKHLKLSRKAPSWTTVVGIVADARAESLENAKIPEIYSSLYQKGGRHLAIFLRGNLDAGAIPEQVREQVQSVDPTIPVFGAQTLNQVVSDSMLQRRLSMELVGLFALTALLLAGIGIYGVISYMVNERTHEIGIRLALGAQGRNILHMVLQQGLRLAITGAAVGLAGALIVSRLMAGLLYDVRPTDPLTFAGVAFLLIAVALLACYIPARRAVRVAPIVALRYE